MYHILNINDKIFHLRRRSHAHAMENDVKKWCVGYIVNFRKMCDILREW